MSIKKWLARPASVAILVPVLAGAAYGATWAVQGRAPFFTGDDPTIPVRPTSSPAEGDARLTLAFGFHPEPLQPQGQVSWTFAVANVSDESVALEFSSGQNADVVLAQGGAERYRWSEGQFFTQAFRTIELEPGETWTFELPGALDVPPGSYELTATVVGGPAPPAAQRSVTVGGPVVGPSPSPYS